MKNLNESNFKTIRLLGGTDVCRKIIEMTIIVQDGKVYDAQTENELVIISGGSRILGWGDLDGLAFTVDFGVCGDYDIPQSTWKKIGGAIDGAFTALLSDFKSPYA